MLVQEVDSVRNLKPAILMLVLCVAVACTQQGSDVNAPTAPTSSLAANTPNSAVMQFGVDTTGSPFPPPTGHDQSGHASRNVNPGTVVIDKGGTVTFMMGPVPVHAIAIYKPGTKPDDINTSIVQLPPPSPPCPPIPLINDPNNREANLGGQRCAGGAAVNSYQFNTPGRYLVICRFVPHFNLGMWGWVTVRDR